MKQINRSGIRTFVLVGALLGGGPLLVAQQPAATQDPAVPADHSTMNQQDPAAAPADGAKMNQQEPSAVPEDGAKTHQPDPSVPADNTKTNQRDRNANEPTADQQKENRSDRDLTQQIRRAIVKDKSLSTYAHNVKIIAQNGVVILKGPVRSDDEKRAIEAKAAEIAGQDKVTSQLDVKAKK